MTMWDVGGGGSRQGPTVNEAHAAAKGGSLRC